MGSTRYNLANGISFAESQVHGPVPESRIVEAEVALGIEFSPSYRDFLLHFGAVDDIAGLPDTSPPGDVVPWHWSDIVKLSQTMRTDLHGREHDLHILYLMSEGGDAWYCFDTSQTDFNGEHPVVLYGPEHDPPVIVSKTFFEFMSVPFGTN